MKAKPVFAFFLLAFGIAWGVPGLALWLSAQTGAFTVSMEEYSPLSYVALWAPALSAFIVIAVNHGWDGVWAYAERLEKWDVGGGWYAAVLLGIPIVNLAAAFGMEWWGQEALRVPRGAIWALLLAALLRATEGPMEEIGWRGFALPLLQRCFSGLGASVILGFLWALWHVPAFVIGRSIGGGISGGLTYVLPMFFAALIAQSVLMTVVYNGTGGSIPLAMLFHWMTNWPYPWETGIDLSPVAGPLWIVVAIVVSITVGRKYLGREHQQVVVAPGLFPEGDEPHPSRDRSDQY